MRRKSIKSLLTSSVLLAVLAACTVQDGARTGLRAITETDGAIQFNAATFAAGASERIIYADTTERDEYALYQSKQHQAEFIYITTRHLHITNLVVDRLFDVDRAINDFRHNQTETPVLGEAFKFAANDIRFWAKAFQLPKAQKTCGAFSGNWDSPPDDLRASKALFGYFCEPGIAPLTQDVIQKTVADVGIRGITVNAIDSAIAFPVLAEIPDQETLKMRAQGEPGDSAGNTAFPYKAVRFFKREDNCRFKTDC